MQEIRLVLRRLMHSIPLPLRVCAVSAAVSAACGQGAVWTLVPPPQHPMSAFAPALAFDAARNKSLYFGGVVASPGGGYLSDQQWLWDGNSWSQSSVTPRPSPRAGAGIANDSVRQRVVLFGGADGGGLGDTWEWDGVAWTSVVASGPSARDGAAMVWDSSRAAVVLFGGFFDGPTFEALNDLWAWNGSQWTQITPTGPLPSGRAYASVAYDSARSRLVVFGGWDEGSAAQQDLWEFNGVAWTQITPPGPRPTWDSGGSNFMAFDQARGRCVLSVAKENEEARETWEWDGAAWTLVAPTPTANPPSGGPMTYDAARQRVLMVTPTQTWEWDGARWTNLAGLGPSARFGHGMTTGADGRPLLFGGGGNDTWRWNGARWEQILTPTAPSKRLVYSSMATYFDNTSARRPMLFGGVDVSTGANNFLGDTWEFTGADWVRRATTGPSPRRLAGLADMGYGPSQGLVLFGGVQDDLQQIYGDTWLYNHATQSWTDITGSIPSLDTPSPRGAYMASRGDGGPPLLFGGLGGVFTAPTRFNDAWVFYNNFPTLTASWSPAVAGVTPPARSAHALTWLLEAFTGGLAGRFVSFGGRNAAGAEINELWECRDIDGLGVGGLGWRQIIPNGPQPSPRALTGLVQIDPSVPNRALLFGGLGASTYGDTWILDLSAFSNYAIDLRNFYSGQSGGTIVMTASQRFSVLPNLVAPQITQWQWRRNGVPLTPGVQPSGSVVSVQSSGQGPGSPFYASTTLTITNARWADAGSYDALGAVPAGMVGSTLTQLIVTCPGDANADGVVNFLDLNAVLSSFGQSTPPGTNGDVNGDGVVNFADLNLVLANYGRAC